MALTRQLANQLHSESTDVYSAAVGSSFLGTIFWLAISVSLLLSAACGISEILHTAVNIIVEAMR